MTAAIRLHPHKNMLLAVASGKGGVGKTWFASTLAAAYGSRGKRTLLIDGDLGLANVDVQLGLNPLEDLASVIAGETSILEATIPVLGGPAKGGFDVIAGRSGSGSLAALNTEALSRLSAGIVSIGMGYDVTILDLAAGVERATLRLASMADHCLVIATDEPTSLTDAYAFIKMLRNAKPGTTPAVVINQAAGKQAAERTYEALSKACENFLRFCPVMAGYVHRDKHVPDAIRKQKPLSATTAHCPAWGDMQRIAERVASL
jgi:flagellar biosynthesis protein FlhG